MWFRITSINFNAYFHKIPDICFSLLRLPTPNNTLPTSKPLSLKYYPTNPAPLHLVLSWIRHKSPLHAGLNSKTASQMRGFACNGFLFLKSFNSIYSSNTPAPWVSSAGFSWLQTSMMFKGFGRTGISNHKPFSSIPLISSMLHFILFMWSFIDTFIYLHIHFFVSIHLYV